VGKGEKIILDENGNLNMELFLLGTIAKSYVIERNSLRVHQFAKLSNFSLLL